MHGRYSITKISTIMECLRDTIHYPEKLSNKQTQMHAKLQWNSSGITAFFHNRTDDLISWMLLLWLSWFFMEPELQACFNSMRIWWIKEIKHRRGKSSKEYKCVEKYLPPLQINFNLRSIFLTEMGGIAFSPEWLGGNEQVLKQVSTWWSHQIFD